MKPEHCRWWNTADLRPFNYVSVLIVNCRTFCSYWNSYKVAAEPLILELFYWIFSIPTLKKYDLIYWWYIFRSFPSLLIFALEFWLLFRCVRLCYQWFWALSFVLPVGLARWLIGWRICYIGMYLVCTTLFVEQSLASCWRWYQRVFVCVCVCLCSYVWVYLCVLRVNWNDERIYRIYRMTTNTFAYFDSIVGKDNQSSLFILNLTAWCGRA